MCKASPFQSFEMTHFLWKGKLSALSFELSGKLSEQEASDCTVGRKLGCRHDRPVVIPRLLQLILVDSHEAKQSL